MDIAIVLELSYYVVPDAQRGGPLRAWCRVALVEMQTSTASMENSVAIP